MIKERNYIKPQKDFSIKFIIGYIIFLIISIYITALLISSSIKSIDNDEKINLINMISSELKIDERQKTATDNKYAVSSYDETYDANSLKIVNYYDIDGNVSTEDKSEDIKYRIHYVQIEGLKNKTIQNKINEKLKQKAYALAFKDSFVYTYVTADFSNILSVIIYTNKEVDTINIDLATGNDIALEDIFVSSTTLNAYLADAIYKTLAWDNLSKSENDSVDMNNIDYSKYEEKVILALNNYKKLKDNLKYSIYNNVVNVYGLIDKNILDTENAQTTPISINLIDHAKEIKIYKRYLTDKSIFDDDTIGVKNTIVFTQDTTTGPNITKISNGKVQANIFVEENYYGNTEEINIDVVKDYIRKLSDEQRSNLMNQTSNNKGTFFQRAYTVTNDIENNYYIINTTSYQALCSVSYFNDEAFLDYIKLKTSFKKDNDIVGFEEYMKDYFPKLEILPTRKESYYISSSRRVIRENQRRSR